MSRRLFSVAIIFTLSLGCRPMLGSSRTYSMPIRPDPICDDSRIRCDSPPDSVPDRRLKLR